MESGTRDFGLLKILFINIHTIKGASRSLYFKTMTEVLHEMEQFYAQLQEATEAETARMWADHKRLTLLVEHYDRIARERLANLLLTSHLSTAQAITDISGRGVGMGAIRQYVEQMGGSVCICLMTAVASDPGFSAFRIEMDLPARYFARPHFGVEIKEAS